MCATLYNDLCDQSSIVRADVLDEGVDAVNSIAAQIKGEVSVCVEERGSFAVDLPTGAKDAGNMRLRSCEDILIVLRIERPFERSSWWGKDRFVNRAADLGREV